MIPIFVNHYSPLFLRKTPALQPGFFTLPAALMTPGDEHRGGYRGRFSVFIYSLMLKNRQSTCTGSVWLAVLSDRDLFNGTVRDRSTVEIHIHCRPCPAIRGGPSLVNLSQSQNSGLTSMVHDASACFFSIVNLCEHREPSPVPMK